MATLLQFIISLLSLNAGAIRASDQSLPLVRFQGCYDGDTCTTTDAEKVRLACIDAPEIKNHPRLRATKMRPTAYDNFYSERSAENLRALVAEVIKAKPSSSKGKYLKKISLSSSMGPSLIIDQATFT